MAHTCEGDRSFSEVLADTLDEGDALADVTGQQVLTTETHAEVTAEIGLLSDGTLDRLVDRSTDR